nr:MAG TPA_asm: hypothetical protein [Caudoviricetes sp.]
MHTVLEFFMHFIPLLFLIFMDFLMFTDPHLL